MCEFVCVVVCVCVCVCVFVCCLFDGLRVVVCLIVSWLLFATGWFRGLCVW